MKLNADDQIKRKTHFGSFSFANMEEKAYEQHRYSYDSFRGDPIDMRICTILAGGKKPGEVYFAAIAPDMELTVITLDEAPDILPCFDESDASIHLPDTSLLLCYNPAQVLKMAGKRYLTGPVILVRTNMDGNFISLTIDDVYRFQKFLASHSVTLMADDQKLPCICIV